MFNKTNLENGIKYFLKRQYHYVTFEGVYLTQLIDE